MRRSTQSHYAAMCCHRSPSWSGILGFRRPVYERLSRLFHRDGKRIKSFRRSWITACVKAGLGTRITDKNGKLIKAVASRIPHDFRRTAIRNLERAGVPRSAAMKMVGHRSESVYRRYCIAEEKMLVEAADKLDHFHALDQHETETTK
jgi:integrase